MWARSRKGSRTGSRLALAVHLGLATGWLVQTPVHAAPPSGASEQSARPAFDIPAQPLDSAVLLFAEQAGLQVLFDSQMLLGLQGMPLKGRFSAQEGLARLLGNNPVEYRFTGERQVTLSRVSAEHGGALALDTTTVSAGNTEGSGSDWVYQAPRSVAVITREQIDKRPPRHAADMLEETAGVYTAVDQRDPGLSINIRGVQDYGRVNMNIDGMRQNFNVNGHQQRNGTMLIDPELVSGVQIDKGSQSGMGGAGVLGGIATFSTINAREFLKDGKEYGGRIRAGHGLGELGNGTFFNGSAVFAFGNEVGDVLLGVSERHFGDYRAGTDNAVNLGSQIRVKDYRREAWKNWLHSEIGEMDTVTRSKLIKFGLNLPEDQRVQLSYLYTDADSNDSWTYELPGEQGYYYRRHSKNNMSAQNIGLDYSYNPDNALIDFKAKVYYVSNRLERANAGSTATPSTGNYYGPYTDHFRTDTWGLQGENTARFDLADYGHLTWNYGAEVYQDSFKPRSDKVEAPNDLSLLPYPEGANPAGKRTMASLFNTLQYEYNDWLSLDGGLRYDRYRLEGVSGITLYRRAPISAGSSGVRTSDIYDIDRQEGRLSPTFGIGIKPGLDWLQVYTRWGRGWRPPAVTEAFMTGRAHGGNSSERVFPNPFLKAEESKDWELGVNIFKESLLFNNDRFGMKVAYFDTRIANFSFLRHSVALPEETTLGGQLGNMAYVNNLNETRFRGVEYQLNYDMGRVYANLSYTHMIGQNEFCSKNFYMGGAKKSGRKVRTDMVTVKLPNGNTITRPVSIYEWIDNPAGNNAQSCQAIFGNASFMPADRGSMTLGARFLERTLDVGMRVRYSEGNAADMEEHNYGFLDQATWPQYTVYDLYASYWATENLNIGLSMENATNEAYFVAMGDASNLSLARGRTLTGMLEYKF